MVKYIVYRKVREIPARCEVDDFISCGLEALIRSIDRYDPDKGATLEQFAWTRIHGAVLDELRRNDWAPRSLRRWDRDITKAREQFIALYGRRPDARRARRRLGISPPSSPAPRQIARPQVGSLNTLVVDEDDTTIERIDTLPSDDRDCRSRAHRRHAREAKERFRAAFDTPAPAGAQGRGPALRLQPDAARDRRDPRRHREPHLPDPRPDPARSCASSSPPTSSCSWPLLPRSPPRAPDPPRAAPDPRRRPPIPAGGPDPRGRPPRRPMRPH